MKIVIAMDSFKGSMTSMEAGEAAKEGICRAFANTKKVPEIIVKPLADGGEGTTESLIEGLGGNYELITVTGPMGKTVTARYGILKDKRTAVMEMAEAAGILLVNGEKKNPWRASTVGVGEMIRDAMKKGCREFIIGIGGSATTEGGIGMLTALGYEFYDKNGELLPPVFESLGKIERISDDNVLPELGECHFQIACDVENPLCGKQGAVYVYGEQKGVKREESELMDKMMAHFAKKTADFFGIDKSFMKGAGASGGLGFAFVSYMKQVTLRSGISIVLDAIRLEKAVKDADYVITGEGCLDGQTVNGKAPIGVAKLAKKHQAKVLAFAGSVTEDGFLCNEAGIDAFFPIVRGVCTLEEAMDTQTAKQNMERAVEQVFKLLV